MYKFNMERVKKLKIVEMAEYVTTKKCTIREAAKEFGISKTTFHRYMVEELPNYSMILARKVKNIFDFNKINGRIRGGMATKVKYENLKKQK